LDQLFPRLGQFKTTFYFDCIARLHQSLVALKISDFLGELGIRPAIQDFQVFTLWLKPFL
jgi:hypothetical protein